MTRADLSWMECEEHDSGAPVTVLLSNPMQRRYSGHTLPEVAAALGQEDRALLSLGDEHRTTNDEKPRNARRGRINPSSCVEVTTACPAVPAPSANRRSLVEKRHL